MLICIFAYLCVFPRTSHWLYLYAAPPRLSCAAPRRRCRADTFFRDCRFTCLLAIDYKSRDRHCVSNSGAVLRHFYARLCWIKIDIAVSLSRTTVFFATPWHRRELSDEWYADHIQFKYDDWRRASPTVRRPFNASSPFRRCHLLRHCHDASAALRVLLVAGYVFFGDIIGCKLCKLLFPVYLVVFSHRHCVS